MEPFKVIRGFRVYTTCACAHPLCWLEPFIPLYSAVCRDTEQFRCARQVTLCCSIQTASRRADVLISIHSRLTCRHESVNFQGWGVLKLFNNSAVLNFDRSRRYNGAAVKYDCIYVRVIDSKHVIGKAGFSYDPIKPAGLTTHSVQHDGVELRFPARQGVFVVP